MRAAILISGSGSNLQAFIDQICSGNLGLQIAVVISNNADAFGLIRAERAGIATQIIEHQAFESREAFDSALMHAIDEANIDLVILAGFMRILSEKFVVHYARRLINIHPSLLPKYPGVNTHQRALDSSDKWHGVSVHFVVPEVDAGPVILQGRLRIKADDNVSSLQQRIHKIEHQIYPLAAQWFINGRLSVIKQQVLLDDETSCEQLQTFDV